MGGGSPSSGPSASETGSENRKTAQYNTEMSFVDQYTPDGNYVYSKIQDRDGDNPPRYRLDTSLSPTGQAKQKGLDNIQLSLLGLGGDQLGRVNNAMSNDFNWKGIPEVGGRDDATSNAMKYLTYGMDDRYANQQGTLENRLAAQGLRPGSTAYTRAMGDFNTGKNEAYERAGLQAYNTGLSEMANSAQMRQQAIQEEAYRRSLPLNELSALISGTQVQTPTFNQINTASAAQQPYSQQYGTNWTSDMLGLGGSLGSAAIMGAFLSRKDAKENFRPAESVLENIRTMPVERWNYRGGHADGGEHIGPYAEDWAARFGGSGTDISVVDAIGVCLKAIQELSAEIDELKQRQNGAEA